MVNTLTYLCLLTIRNIIIRQTNIHTSLFPSLQYLPPELKFQLLSLLRRFHILNEHPYVLQYLFSPEWSELNLTNCWRLLDTQLSQHSSSSSSSSPSSSSPSSTLLPPLSLITLLQQSHNITTLNLTGMLFLSDDSFLPLLSHLPSLRSLTLARCALLSAHAYACALRACAASLAHFDASHCTHMSSLLDTLLKEGITLPLLRSLSLVDCYEMWDIKFALFLQHTVAADKLEYLNIAGCSGLRNAFDIIAMYCVSLQTLDVSGCYCVFFGSISLEFPSLTSLSIHGVKEFTINPIAATFLTHLDVSASSISSENFMLLIKSNPNIVSLNFDLDEVETDDYKYFPTKLTTLKINSKDIHNFANILHNYTGDLQILSCRNALGTETLFEDMSNCINLTDLYLDGSPSGISVEYLPAVLKKIGHNLKTLSLSGIGRMPDECVHLIAQKCKKLKHINLNKRYASSLSLVSLIRSCHSLESINFSNNKRILEPFVWELAQAPCCSSLQTLKLGGCKNIGPIGIVVSKLRNLTILDVSANSAISDTCLRGITFHNSNHFRKLNVSGCKKISESGFLDLIKQCRVLRSLNFAGCGVTNLLVENIVGHCLHLQKLNIQKCINVTLQSASVLTKCSFLTNLKADVIPEHYYRNENLRSLE